MSLLRPYVEGAYRRVREEHLLPPETTAYKPSPFSSTSPERGGPALPSYPAGFPRDHRRLTALQASVPQQSSAQAGDGVDTRRAVTDKPRGRRRRRRSSPKDGGSGDAGEQGKFSSRGLLI
jgi:hypothetical protein